MLQYWELTEQERSIHSLFSTSAATTRFLQWQCTSVYNSGTPITSICPSRNVWVSGSEPSGHSQHHLVIATANGDMICLHRENMKQVRYFFMKHLAFLLTFIILYQVAQLNVSEKANHDVAGSQLVTATSFTATGNALVAFDNRATMFICRLSPITDPGMLFFQIIGFQRVV